MFKTWKRKVSRSTVRAFSIIASCSIFSQDTFIPAMITLDYYTFSDSFIKLTPYLSLTKNPLTKTYCQEEVSRIEIRKVLYFYLKKCQTLMKCERKSKDFRYFFNETKSFSIDIDKRMYKLTSLL